MSIEVYERLVEKFELYALLEKGMKDFVVCLKKGKTRLKELQRLYAYCKEMDYRILAIVLF